MDKGTIGHIGIIDISIAAIKAVLQGREIPASDFDLTRLPKDFAVLDAEFDEWYSDETGQRFAHLRVFIESPEINVDLTAEHHGLLPHGMKWFGMIGGCEDAESRCPDHRPSGKKPGNDSCMTCGRPAVRLTYALEGNSDCMFRVIRDGPGGVPWADRRRLVPRKHNAAVRTATTGG